MIDSGSSNMIIEAIAAIAASIYGADKLIPHIKARKSGKNGNGNGNDLQGHILIDKKAHDEICSLRLKPIQEDLKELKNDVKILIGRH